VKSQLQTQELSRTRQQEFRSFVDREVVPDANVWDAEQRIPREIIDKVSRAGYLGLALPLEFGGGGEDAITYGFLHEQIGRGCSSLRSILTVHTMIGHAIWRWGNGFQKTVLLPKIASGELLAAFCLTEADAGSDAGAIEAIAARTENGFVISGVKKWVTAGDIADLYLVFAKLEGKPAAFLVPRDSPGLSRKSIRDVLSIKAAMLADVTFHDCIVPTDHMLGGPGFGLSCVAATALDLGRYSIAWGSVGIAQACLDACGAYASTRQQFGKYLRDHQLVQEMLTHAMMHTQAARLMCLHAGQSRIAGSPEAVVHTAMAKLFATRSATRIVSDTMQIHGAVGFGPGSSLARFFRDAKLMEVIEGSTQILQVLITEAGLEQALSTANPGNIVSQ
jgi:glutaryl-CoA dehydrogenase (non-decarboxylating)